jgi:serine/threonine-protein kinase RsbT
MNFFQAMYRNDGDTTFIKRSFKIHAKELGISDIKIEKMNVAISEVLSNVTKYAGGYAEICCRPILSIDKIIGIELIVKDYGPGIENLKLYLKDGYSTGGSLGFGLGSMERMVDKFEIKSITEKQNFVKRGTEIKLGCFISLDEKNLNKRILMNENKVNLDVWGIAGRSQPLKPSSKGDEIYWTENKSQIIALIIDSENFGPTTDILINKTKFLIKLLLNKEYSLEKIIYEINMSLENDERLNLLLVLIQKESKVMNYVCIGNVSIQILIDANKLIHLSNDQVGLGSRDSKYSIFKYTLPQEFVIVMHSYGLSKEWINNVNHLTIQNHGQFILLRELFEKYRNSNRNCSVIIIQNH